MKLPGQRLVRDLGTVEIGDTKFGAELHENRYDDPVNPPRRHIYLARTARERRLVQRHPSGDDTTRLSYIVFGEDRALFIGMSVRKALRGRGLARPMFQYFQQFVEGEELDFVGTARIHKPLLALTLAQEGLTPKSTSCMAEILPVPLQGSEIPVIRFLSQGLEPEQMKSRSVHHDFYTVAPPELVPAGPPDTSHVVALHTRYLPPALAAS